jgi:hypothetical protein
MDATTHEDPAAAPVLIDFPEAAPVRARRSWWGAFLVACFTGLTCLGLAASALSPRLLDRARDRGETTSGSSTSPSSPVVARPSDRPPVAGLARILTRDSDDSATIRILVSGVTDVGTRRLAVRARIAGDEVADGTVVLDATGTSGAGPDAVDGAVPWSTVLEVPSRGLPDDGVATVTIAWAATDGTPASATFVVALADGRGRESGSSAKPRS